MKKRVSFKDTAEAVRGVDPQERGGIDGSGSRIRLRLCPYAYVVTSSRQAARQPARKQLCNLPEETKQQ